MRNGSRVMALTADLVERVRRPVGPLPPDPDYEPTTDEHLEEMAREVLRVHRTGDDIWTFAYGSLLWKPAEVVHLEERIGTARGWHRSFSMRLKAFRGTPERPGLMMGLVRGGQCTGIVRRIDGRAANESLAKLLRREMPVRPLNVPRTHEPRWIKVETAGGVVRALAFVINPRGHAYTGRLTPEETAAIVATACGPGGSCAEYLFNTVLHLRERGIHDSGLWRLQSLVAERIATLPDDFA